VASEPGNERLAIDQVAEAVAGLGLTGQRLERLKTAVGEATMNAIEHGNGNRPELPVEVTVVTDDTDLTVRITDQGGDRGDLPDVETPDLEAKLAGLQTPRGWGLFLIQNMVDRLETAVNEHHHTIELVMHLKEEPDARS
jgi:anti-sigma regulatory factor (Ser/Thr protein kinase)